LRWRTGRHRGAERRGGRSGQTDCRSGAASAGRRNRKESEQGDIRLTLADDPARLGIAGDGFTIRPRSDGGVELAAGTVLGLRQAVQSVADHISLHGPEAGVPLVAANPVVPLRGGGFGGGTFEVDFPYGSVAEWERVLDGLLDSGMNVLTCLGMWGNWKMPVTYRHLPALASDDPEAYDESSGTLLSEVDAHREHGLHLLRHVQRQGAASGCGFPSDACRQHSRGLFPRR
jgi:hypothetical protein